MKEETTLKFTAIREALADSRLRKLDVSVYACLIGHARGFTSRPSRVRIGKETGITPINACRHTARLAESGYIEVTRSKGRNTNIYRLHRLEVLSVAANLDMNDSAGHLGISGDTSRGVHLGISGEAVEPKMSQLKGLDGGHLGISGDTQSLKANNGSGEVFPVQEVKRLWNENRLDVWYQWTATTEGLHRQVSACLSLVAEFLEKDVDAAVVVELFEFLAKVDFFNGKRVKDDGNLFRLSPAYLFGDEDRFVRIMNGEWFEYGKPGAPTRPQRKMLA